MAKQLNVNLAFTADTSKARTQLNELQQQLSAVINMPTTNFGNNMADKIQAASKAAAELKIHLQNATNVKTGSLDFTKLNQSIKNSGASLSDYAAKIQSIGPEGQKAFAMLAQSVASAEVPIRRSNALLSELWVTMKNTARWQLTSSVLHGFMGAVQSALGYTKDLNESLNNIRIVTGNSVDQMADFAKEANKAAKALSTSTTSYTNAALIYYQQGLDEQQVKERADVTIRMANVSRQSAEEVSDQLTAIWNNFYDGSQSLEHYADAMTRLGADTASSSDEIAQGLEKFAAIGDMIGLSFDNAAAALATVTATTRQSADVVGNSFKTIFARIQGLNLGETLEDGTTLNKYSEALFKVGINIKDQNGELKDMDAILAEMGEKWQYLTKDQQVALAQTVAGVRQYNQLVALMENFDFYQENLSSAMNADGSLAEQAEIYEESWEAARKRVKASLEGLYDSLINDESFIDLLNIIEKVVSGVENLVDSIGGFGSVVSGLGIIFMKVFQSQISDSLTNASYSLMSWTEKGRQKIREEKKDEIQKIIDLQGNASPGSVEDVRNKVLKAQLESQQKLIDAARELNSFEQETYRILLDQQKVRGELAIKAAEEVENAKQKVAASEADLFSGANHLDLEKDSPEQTTQLAFLGDIEQAANDLANLKLQFKQEGGTSLAKAIVGDEGSDLMDIALDIIAVEEQLNVLIEALAGTDTVLAKKLRTHAANVENLAQKTDISKKATIEAEKTLKLQSETLNQNTDETVKNTEASLKMAEAENKVENEVDQVTEELVQQNKVLEENKQKKKGLTSAEMAKNFTAGASAAMSAVTAIQSLSGAIDVLQSDAEPVQKVTSLFSSLFMTAVTTKSSLEQLNKITNAQKQSLGQLAANTGFAQKVLGVFGVKTGEAGVATASLGVQLGSLFVYIGAIAAATIALTAIIKEVIDAWHDDEKAVKGAYEAVKQATEAFNEAKDSLDNLKESLEKYESLQNSFDHLTEGTKEWNQALEESNEHISEMLRQYPELARYFKNDNGRFKLETEDGKSAYDEIENLYKDKKNKASIALNTSQLALNLAENRNLRTQALRNEEYQGAFYLDPKYSTGEAIDVSKAQEDLKKALNDLQGAYETTGSAVFTSYDEFAAVFEDTSESTIKALWNNRESLEKLAIETNLNTAQMRALINAGIGDQLANDEVYQNLNEDEQSLMGTIVANRVANALIDTTSTEYQIARQEASADIFGSGGGFTKDDYKAYLDARFGAESANYRVVNKAGNDATLQKKNEDGTWTNVGEKNSLSNTEVLDFMTAYKLQNGVNDADQDIFDDLQEVVDVLKSSRSLEDNTLNTREDDLKLLQLQKDLATEGVTSLVNFSPSEVKQIEEALSSKTQLIAREYSDAIQYAIRNYKPEEYANNIIAQEREKIQGIFESAAVELEISSETFESYAASLMEADGQLTNFAEITGETAKETAELRAEHAKMMTAYSKAAVAQYKLAKGLNTVQKVYKDNKAILEENNEASLDFHEAVGALSEALSEAFGMEVDASFVKDNLELIKKAANGSEEALVELRAELNKDFVMSLNLETENAHTALIDELNRMSQEALSKDITAEITMNNSDAIAALNEALYTGQATIQDIEAMFNNANLTMPEYKTTTVDGEAVTSETDTEFKGPFGLKWKAHSTSTTRSKRVVPYFGDNPPTVTENKDGTSSVDYGGGGSITTSSAGGLQQLDNVLDYEGDNGSSGSKYNPEADRYHEITNEIEKQERALKRLQKEKNKLFGANKLQAIDNEITAIKGLASANEELLRQQQAHLQIDAANLLNLFPQADISNGYIANYNELLMKTVSEEQKKILDQYEATWEAIQATEDKLIDFNDQILDLNYDKINYELELKVDINESELELLDLYLKEYEDSFYKMAESLAKMRDQGDIYSTMLGDYYNTWQTLKESYADKDIDQEKYIAGLETVRDGIYGQLEALIDLDKEMMNFYGETLDAADEELESHTSHMEHLTSVFDYYLDLMDILGKSKDYDVIGDFLQGKADTLRNQLDVQKDWLDRLREQQTAVEADLKAARAAGDEEQIELLEKQQKAIIEKVDEAQEEVLSLTAEWAEAMKSVIENNMAEIADTLEKSLTDGLGFDTLMDNFDKLNTRQEEYLTKTNQIYETNKLMRTANKALDETDNKVAKQKLQNFINETKSLQENNKLSKYELEIQQAKYDLLLAEIALEEAQNAKSVVRLSRDNEGNFGYVYTADENQIADAQQAVDDKKNSLYNLSLEGQQEYTEKYLQAQQEMFNELKELQDAYLSGEIASEEEYRNRQQEIVNHYYGEDGVLTTYSKLYNIAVQTDAKATADYWGGQYGEMTQDTKKWKEDVDQYLLNIQAQTNNWKDVSTQANEAVEGALKDSKDATKDLTDESEDLKDMIKDEVLPQLNNEISRVQTLTAEYGKERTSIKNLISEYRNYISILNQAIAAAARMADADPGGKYQAPSTNVGTALSGSDQIGGNPSTPNKEEDPPQQGDIQIKWAWALARDNKYYIRKSGFIYESQREAWSAGYESRTKLAQEKQSIYHVLTFSSDSGMNLTKDNETSTNNISSGESNIGKTATFQQVDADGVPVEGKIKNVKIENAGIVNGIPQYKADPYGNGSAWYPKNYFTFATGGYTGAWGPEGKLAVLHQKELVLNADDTENILNTVNLVREIVRVIDAQASMASSMNITASSGIVTGNETLEQTVTIHAEFPNATDHNEIEEAFKNLINTASQYANRKI